MAPLRYARRPPLQDGLFRIGPGDLVLGGFRDGLPERAPPWPVPRSLWPWLTLADGLSADLGSRVMSDDHADPGSALSVMEQRLRAVRHFAGRAETGHTVSGGGRLLKSADGLGGRAGTSLDAAAAAMARGASGMWLRAVSRLGLACRARSTCWSATLPSVSRSPRTGGAARRRAAPGRCRRPSPRLGDGCR